MGSTRRAPAAQVLGDRGLAAVFGPAEWGAIVDRIADVQPRPALDEQAHDIEMLRPYGVVQRRGVRMEAVRVVAARVLAGVKEEAHYVGVAVLRGERQGDVSAPAVRGRQQASGVL